MVRGKMGERGVSPGSERNMAHAEHAQRKPRAAVAAPTTAEQSRHVTGKVD